MLDLWHAHKENGERVRSALRPPQAPRPGAEVDPKQADLRAYFAENPMVPATYEIHARYLVKLHAAAFQARAKVDQVPVILMVLNALAPMAKLKAWSVFNRYFTWRARKHNQASPMLHVPRPKVFSKPKQGLDREALVKVMKLARTWPNQPSVQARFAGMRFEAMLSLMLWFGLRSGELIGMSLGDIAQGCRSFVVTRKGGSPWTVSLDGAQAEMLRAYVRAMIARASDCGITTNRESPVWILWKAKPVNIWSWEKQFNDALERAGIESKCGGPHQLRHTMARVMVEEKKDLSEVSRYLGHRHVSSTDYYLKHHFGQKSQAGADLVNRLIEESVLDQGSNVVPLSTVEGDKHGKD